MTSEIVIMNRRAIALAADSAVTSSSVRNGQKQRRYFKGANKVFELSFHEPVGIMIFDVADLHAVPWEVAIKMYRDRLGRTSYPTLTEYAEGLFTFLETHSGLFPPDRRKESFRSDSFSAAVAILDDIEDDNLVRSQPDDTSKNAVRPKILANFVNLYAAMPVPTHFSASTISSAIAAGKNELEAAIGTLLNARGIIISAASISTLAIEALFKDYKRFLAHTGIVVAGYGRDSHFPSFVQHDVYGLSLGTFIFDVGIGAAITTESSSHIQAFAQTDMGWTFMAGISPDVFKEAIDGVRRSLDATIGRVLGDVGITSLATRQTIVDDEVKKFTDRMFKIQAENHYNPLRGVISLLPVEEMADLAETMISLESLKEKVTAPSESVGGAVDVALITRAEGLVWIRRKHYFDVTLNGRFAERQRQRMV